MDTHGPLIAICCSNFVQTPNIRNDSNLLRIKSFAFDPDSSRKIRSHSNPQKYRNTFIGAGESLIPNRFSPIKIERTLYAGGRFTLMDDDIYREWFGGGRDSC